MGQSQVLDVRLGMLHLTFSVIYLNADNEIYSLRIEKVGRIWRTTTTKKPVVCQRSFLVWYLSML